MLFCMEIGHTLRYDAFAGVFGVRLHSCPADHPSTNHLNPLLLPKLFSSLLHTWTVVLYAYARVAFVSAVTTKWWENRGVLPLPSSCKKDAAQTKCNRANGAGWRGSNVGTEED
jgi:hypothetical protein